MRINEVRQLQKIAGILKESEINEEGSGTLADINPEELGTMMNKPKEWEYKDLVVLDGEFTKKHPNYKDKDAVFLFYDNREKLVAVEFEDGKSANLNPNELKIK